MLIPYTVKGVSNIHCLGSQALGCDSASTFAPFGYRWVLNGIPVSTANGYWALQCKAMSVWFTWSLHQAKPGKSVLISTAFARSKCFYAAMLAVNLVCTCKHIHQILHFISHFHVTACVVLIAFRIWHIHHASNCITDQKHKNNVLSAILESGV